MPTHPCAVVAENVRGAVTRSGLSIRQLADRTDISYSALRRKVSGDVAFSFGELLRIAELLGVRPAALLDEGGAPERPGAGERASHPSGSVYPPSPVSPS
ncbi:helix-turn-helix domain-containing protein [Microbacterium resistens]|uniref:helix-turn-helix domain-containing protein n=1 Tax=Microbacterium resistens TaxID=156977 RepID=UPI000A049D09